MLWVQDPVYWVLCLYALWVEEQQESGQKDLHPSKGWLQEREELCLRTHQLLNLFPTSYGRYRMSHPNMISNQTLEIPIWSHSNLSVISTTTVMEEDPFEHSVDSPNKIQDDVDELFKDSD